MMKILLTIVLLSMFLGICVSGCGNQTKCTNEQNQCNGNIAQNCLMTCSFGPCDYSMHETNCEEEGLGSCSVVTQKPYPFMCNSGMAGFGNGPWAACQKWTQPACDHDADNKCEDNVSHKCHEYCCGEGCVYFPYSPETCQPGSTCIINDQGEAACQAPQTPSCPSSDPSCANSDNN